MSGNDSSDKYHHVEYFHFMFNHLNELIRYSDSKHTLGMTLVVSILFAANEFIFAKIDRSVYEVRLILDVNVASALLAIAFGYMGIFPKFISPKFSNKRVVERPNIFYFKEISRCDLDALRAAIDETFPNSGLNQRYRDNAVAEIYALSKIVVRKFDIFKLFLYALFFFLVTLGWLFLSSVLELSARAV